MRKLEKKYVSFEPDTFIEQLLVLREREAVKYSALPDAVKQAVKEYEREKKAATFDLHAQGG